MRATFVTMLSILACSAACDRTERGESDLARNAEQAVTTNTKSSPALGGNNAPADDAGHGVTAAQAAEAGVRLDAEAAGDDEECEGAARNCGPR